MEAWRAYQQAFHDFSGCVRHLQTITTDPHPDQAAIEAAIIEVEKTRLVYDSCRDALAVHLLPVSSRTTLPLADSPEAIDEHIKSIAGLLWESAGRPDGTADEDWRRAQDIVRRAATAA